ncbi:MAG TPA: IscS subfamily cysteine desulfurase [Anaeromyxobacter sp.]|nr:IscS subfamily cysteine desulfurase [Anaeromyxobacter sp.]
MKTPVYMDHHATTPVDPRVLEVMLPYFTTEFGNAASKSHVFGWRAAEAVEAAREEVARLIGAAAREIVFTSGATESDNLALKGVARFHAARGRHIVTCRTEHKAVLDAALSLERQGFVVTRLEVEPDGRLDPERVRAALRPDTVLVSVMHANNETGVVHPIAEIAKVARAAGVPFHCDAAQSAGKIPFDVEALGVDLVSLSAHKMYGPKGIGALYLRRRPVRARLLPEIDGGGHERGYRSGTLNVPGIVGFGKAAELARLLGPAEAARLFDLRERLRRGLLDRLSGVSVNGSLAHRLPGNLNVSFAGVEGEALILSARQVAVSSGSACTSASLEPSYVLRAMGVKEDLAHASIRFGLGRGNTEEEVDYAVQVFVEKVEALRAMAPGAGEAEADAAPGPARR